ncbi:Methyltransferase domain-containing protein [Alteromonadaceae bacterium Bs31]|nr:Methyltransferase domain-containing protein [Alteromonadaceae bacterium Bs31]
MTGRSFSCPLCHSVECTAYYQDKRRHYYKCSCCALVFVPSPYHLSEQMEKAEYDKHQNSLDDPGYRTFLSRLFDPLLDGLPENARGLDFGCGPGPALGKMFEERGCLVALYDQFYARDANVLQKKYDFVTATEVVEHLRQPSESLRLIWDLIVPSGYFGLMTKLVINKKRFKSWHYKNDPTHIIFFSIDTLNYLANSWNAELFCVADDAFIFRKP